MLRQGALPYAARLDAQAIADAKAAMSGFGCCTGGLTRVQATTVASKRIRAEALFNSEPGTDHSESQPLIWAKNAGRVLF
jgi:hypothetical protein